MSDTGRPSDGAGPGAAHDNVGALVEVAGEATKSHLLARGFVLGAVVTAAMAVFIVQNTASIGFEWLWFDFDAPLWSVLLVAFAAGLVAGPLMLAGWRRTTRQQAKRRQIVDRFRRRRSGKASSHPPRRDEDGRSMRSRNDDTA